MKYIFLDHIQSRIDKRARRLPVPDLNIAAELTSKHFPKECFKNVKDYREALMRLVHLHQTHVQKSPEQKNSKLESMAVHTAALLARTFS
jgi:hypothetical protein